MLTAINGLAINLGGSSSLQHPDEKHYLPTPPTQQQ